MLFINNPKKQKIMENVIEGNKENFKDLIAQEKVTIVDF